MSWWKWLIPIGAAAAIPFTGGLSALGMGAGAGNAEGAKSAAGRASTLASILGLAGAGVQAATGIYGAKQQQQGLADQVAAAKYAADLQAKGTADQLGYLKDVEARRRQEYDQSQAKSQAQWDAQQQLRAPYRAASRSILDMMMTPQAPAASAGTLGSLMGRG